MEACPQYGESQAFVGPASLAAVRLMNAHPTGKYQKEKRLHALMGSGGIAECGNAQNCVEACPKDIPLTTGIAEVGRDVTKQVLKDWFKK